MTLPLNRSLWTSALLLSGFLFGGCAAREKNYQINEKPVIETLLKSTESWAGDVYSYPEGKAEMTLLRISVPVGFRTPVHRHLQPGVAYVLSGRLECVVTADKTLISEPGDSFATTFGDVPHYCENIGEEEAIIFVAYAGVVGQSVTVPWQKKSI